MRPFFCFFQCKRLKRLNGFYLNMQFLKLFLTYMDRREGKLTKIHQAKEYRKAHSYKTMRIVKRWREGEKQ